MSSKVIDYGRMELAARLMAGMLANPKLNTNLTTEELVAEAYAMADLLKLMAIQVAANDD
jgi:hypothetical protein